MKRISFIKSAFNELLTLKSFVMIGLLSFLYILFSVYLLNYRLVIGTFVGDYSLIYKLTIILNLLLGTWTAISKFDFFLLLITSVLVGLNVLLMIKTIYVLQYMGKHIKLSIGGATLIGLITTGCTSCGLSLFSILGLSASLSFLPFHGLELHLGAIVLLLISGIYMLKQLWNAKYCRV